jgi:hypothetical protein
MQGHTAAPKDLLDLNAQLSEVLLVPHKLVSVLCLVEGEDLFVDDGLDVVCFDGAVHLFELQPAADEDSADGANVVLERYASQRSCSMEKVRNGRLTRQSRKVGCCSPLTPPRKPMMEMTPSKAMALRDWVCGG